MRSHRFNNSESLSPAALLFNSTCFNCYVIAIIGCKTRFNSEIIKEGLCQTMLKHPRFTSKPVKQGKKTKWIQAPVDLNNHIIIPELHSIPPSPNGFMEDYISSFTKTPLDSSKPLWEVHLLDLKTSDDVESVAIFRIHHSIGDGASLISLLIAATRQTSDPSALPTVPIQKKRRPSGSFLLRMMSLIWNSVVDVLLLVLTILFVKDTKTSLKGAVGVEKTVKRFVYRNVSLDDIKLVKNEMNTTINDVLLGMTQAGLSRYLNRENSVGANDGAANQRSSSVLKNIHLRASILVNIRPTPGLQDLADMMAEKSQAKWGNQMGCVIMPFSIGLHEDPLEYVRQAKATIDRKKNSFEAIFSYAFAKLALKLFGVEAASALTRRTLSHTTLAFSNVPGPVEEVSFYGHPVAFIAPSVYGHPSALTIHFQSYANKMTISMAVDPATIPNPYLLCDDLEESLNLICDVVKRRQVDDMVQH